ncbi:tigger transposable element-derived protein 1-like [Vespa velutina]|uniref:tigger transposable element-derived protein 1-like n=1 Tax=Vespa velutina TaxID=202808 RepID=UPI001FB48EE9|nr:tigger transposable element-derived protein 1-like [Vespa velutina]
MLKPYFQIPRSPRMQDWKVQHKYSLKMNNYSQKKVKRQAIPLETKILILNRLTDGEGSTTVANEFKLEKTEKALVLWVKDLSKKRIPVHKELIQEKARQYFNQLKDLESNSSYCLRNIQGEATYADETTAMNYRKVLAEIIDDGESCPDQVFNADETGLFWKKMSNRKFIAKSEKTASGFKVAKDRITLLCSNVSDAKILTQLIINKALHPLKYSSWPVNKHGSHQLYLQHASTILLY